MTASVTVSCSTEGEWACARAEADCLPCSVRPPLGIHKPRMLHVHSMLWSAPRNGSSHHKESVPLLALHRAPGCCLTEALPRVAVKSVDLDTWAPEQVAVS